ncbi:MAG: ATPase [Methylococcales bacterium]
MRMSPREFLDCESKRITLLGMSGVGKTTLSNHLPQDRWFHYSGDYRIGTKYLEEPILDNIKRQAMEIPFLRDLLRSDSIYICNNITVDNLYPVSTFLGKMGKKSLGGLALDEFKHRQNLHRDAEIKAMLDVPEFIRKAERIYGYKHFINDAGGSLCELDFPKVIETLAQHTIIIYLKASTKLEEMLIQRARQNPKPLYYREAFLDEHLKMFMRDNNIDSPDEIIPDEFVSWIFPKLFYSRLPRYDIIANEFGYVLAAEDIAQVKSEQNFLDLVADAMRKRT